MLNKSTFAKTMESVKKNPRDSKLVTTEKRRNYLLSEPSYHSTKFFTENLLTIKRGKTQIIKNKLVYLDLSVLELRKIVMYEFLYDCETEI